MKIMHISPIESHPCFTDLIEKQKEKHSIIFVKLNFVNEDLPYKIIENSEDNLSIKNIKKCCDQRYNNKLRKIFDSLFKKYKPDIIHIQVFSGISLLPILNVASSLGIKKVLTLHDYSLFCIKGICYGGKNKCEIDSLSNCDCKECLEHAFVYKKSFLFKHPTFSITPDSYNKLRGNWIENIINQSDKIICPSKNQKDQLIKLFGKQKKFVTLYYGVELPKFSAKREKKSKPAFGYLGTLAWTKGIPIIKNAIEKLHNYDFRLLMGLTYNANNPNDKKILEKLDKYSKTTLMKNIGRGHLYDKFFSRIDYLIIPSIWNETGPMTLFESFYYQVPVIISNNQSMVEKIKENKSSRIFNNEDELVNVMKDIINGKTKKYPNDYFKIKNIDEYYEEIESVYKEIKSIESKGLFLKLGYKCNNNCTFCVTGDNHPREFIDFKIIKKTLEQNNKKYNSIVLTGGEPTIRKDFFRILELAYKLGYRITLQTNARMFFYEKFCDKIKDYELKLMININGPNARIHDAITCVKGSFEQTISGVKNLQKYGFYITGKIMLTRLNYKYVLNTVKFMHKLGLKEVWLVFLTPFGSAKKNFEIVVPKYSEVIPFVNKTLFWLKKNTNVNIGVEGFPYCCLHPEFRSFITEENLTEESLHGIYSGEDNYEYNCKRERVLNQKQKFDICAKCKYNSTCEGVYKEYVKKNGKEEFKAIR